MSTPAQRWDRKVHEISGWYCPCGNPRGFEESVFRAQGLVPLQPTTTYRAMVRSTGFLVQEGHDASAKGDRWMWVPPALAKLIPSGLAMGVRERVCQRIGGLKGDNRKTVLAEFLAITYLAGIEIAVQSVFNMNTWGIDR